jgi:hypothetical protein
MNRDSSGWPIREQQARLSARQHREALVLDREKAAEWPRRGMQILFRQQCDLASQTVERGVLDRSAHKIGTREQRNRDGGEDRSTNRQTQPRLQRHQNLPRRAVFAGAVADTANGFDQIRARQFLSQLRNMDVDSARPSRKGKAPNALEQAVTGDDPAGVFDQLGQKLELQRAQWNRRSGNRDSSLAPVEANVAELDDAGLLRSRLSAPQDCAHARNELAGRERFGHIVVGTKLEPDDPINLLVARGQDQNRHASARPKLSTYLETVEIGQGEIKHDNPRVVPLDRLEPCLTGVFADGSEACPFEIGDYQRTNSLVVLNHNRGRAHGRNALTATTTRPLWTTRATSPRRS